MSKTLRLFVAVVLPAVSVAGMPGPARALPQSALVPSRSSRLPASVASAPPVSAEPMPLRGSPGLLGLVHELERRSPTVGSMLATLRERRVPITFGTFEEMEAAVRAAFRSYDPSQSRAIGYMVPRVQRGPGGRGLTTDEILVGIDLARLDELFVGVEETGLLAPGTGDRARQLETLALLGHEIAHAWGLVVSGGDPRRGCTDPQEGQLPETACVMVVENLVRREIGAPRDWRYGLGSPATLAERYGAWERRREASREVAATSLAWTRRFGAAAPAGIARAGKIHDPSTDRRPPARPRPCGRARAPTSEPGIPGPHEGPQTTGRHR